MMDPSVAGIPIGVLTDSYKASHYVMYPEANKMVAYGEFRAPFAGQTEDERLVFYGIRYIVENYLSRQWTLEDVEKCDKFYATHNALNSKFPFPKDLFTKFVKENNGYFPVKVEALPEGSVVHIHTPVYQISCEKEYSRLCTFFETILTHVWYPSCVATLSRMSKEIIEEYFEKTVDPESFFLLSSRLHDFGFRGTTSVEQSVIGGAAHLLNFDGSDTMSACYYVQFNLNNGKPVGSSIPATEHSVMTAWPTEKDALTHTIQNFGHGIFATVMDSYDYHNALNKIVPSVAEQKKSKGGFWVLRPDSGDPVEAILAALRAGEKTFGAFVNKKGYKVLNGIGCIQGDGINKNTIRDILEAATKEGYSAQNIAFGMGGGLLQKVNRDTMSFATKLSFIEYKDGTTRDVMKLPKTDSGKSSLPGILKVKRDSQGKEYVYPKTEEDSENLLKVVYDHKPLFGIWDDFETLRKRVETEWKRAPKKHDVVSSELKTKIENWKKEQKKVLENLYK